jgi:UDP-2,3-diacylglucosamine hydrolase
MSESAPSPAEPLPVLGVIAGGGPLPGRVAAAAAASGRAVFIVGLEGFADRSVIGAWPHAFARIGAAGRILGQLRAHACKDLVLIGPIRRPSFFDLRPDADGAKIMARIGRAAFAGDDGLLSAVIRVLGEEGFRVLGAPDILKAALGPRGLLTRAKPDATALADIERGIAVTRALGSVDVGQACVVRAGVVIAVEAVEGTDAMLSRCGPLLEALDGVYPGGARPGGSDPGRANPGGANPGSSDPSGAKSGSSDPSGAKSGGVLVKSVKPGQDRRVDLPTIGPETIRLAAAAGLAGVAYDASGTILAAREAAIAGADERGLFLLGFDPATNDKRS